MVFVSGAKHAPSSGVMDAITVGRWLFYTAMPSHQALPNLPFDFVSLGGKDLPNGAQESQSPF